jgi:hypothetical protein
MLDETDLNLSVYWYENGEKKTMTMSEMATIANTPEFREFLTNEINNEILEKLKDSKCLPQKDKSNTTIQKGLE